MMIKIEVYHSEGNSVFSSDIFEIAVPRGSHVNPKSIIETVNKAITQTVQRRIGFRKEEINVK